MCYKENAFDNYDSILCVGDHQIKEIREREKIKNLQRKNIIKYFHNRIFELNNYKKNNKIKIDKNKILICSSWGEGSIAENLNEEFIINLLNKNYRVFLQFHHMQLNRKKEIKINYEKLKKNYSNFLYSFNYINIDHLSKFSTMISDWSGAATEFAFGFERKVIFLNLPKKIRNKNYKFLKIEPLEVFIRSKIGTIVELNDLMNMEKYLNKIIGQQFSAQTKMQIKKIKNTYLFSKPDKNYLLSQILN